MNLRSLLPLGLLVACATLSAAEPPVAPVTDSAPAAAAPAAPTALAPGNTVLATRGDAVIEVADIDAFAAQVPPRDRSAVVGTEERVTTLLQNLLLNRQLANEFVKLGLDKDPLVQRELRIATEKVLARRSLEHYVEQQPKPNLEQLARETYLTDKSKFKTPESRAVQHILINNKDRSDAEALKLVDQVAAEAAQPGADFEALVMKYSDDPAKSSNRGIYGIDDTADGRMDPAFLTAARGLAQVGDIAPHVSGIYGYHVMKLVDHKEPRQLTFDEVKAPLMEQLRAAYNKRLQDEHTEALRLQDPEIDVDVARGLSTRYQQSPLAPAAAAPKAD